MGDEELATLARHFLLPAGAGRRRPMQFAASRQQQLAQRSHYQQQLVELEQQLAASRGQHGRRPAGSSTGGGARPV